MGLGADGVRKSYFFKGSELPFRLALFWTSLRVTDVVAPLLAFGILRLRGTFGYEGWRWLFLIEGLFTLLFGVWSVFSMAPGPTQTKSWFNKESWFTEREEVILVTRILRDDPSKVGFNLLHTALFNLPARQVLMMRNYREICITARPSTSSFSGSH